MICGGYSLVAGRGIVVGCFAEVGGEFVLNGNIALSEDETTCVVGVWWLPDSLSLAH